MTIVATESAPLARVLLDNQDFCSLEVDNVRNFLARFESDGKVQTISTLGVVFDGVEANFFYVPIFYKYYTIIILLQILGSRRNVPVHPSRVE